MLPRLTSAEPLPARVLEVLHTQVTLVEPSVDGVLPAADFVLLPATAPVRVVAAHRDALSHAQVIGFSENQPLMQQRLRWIRAGGDDICAIHALPRLVGRLWQQSQTEGGRRLDSFLGGLGAYMEKRTSVVGDRLGRYVDLVRQREGLMGVPGTLRWPAILTGMGSVRQGLEIRGTVLRFGGDTVEVAFPVGLKARESLRFWVAGQQYQGQLEGEVTRLEGTAQGWWVATVLIQNVLIQHVLAQSGPVPNVTANTP